MQLSFKEVWVVVGEVTDPAAHQGAAVLGQPEYQFSDGPAGHRGYSADYIDLEHGLQEHSGCIIHWDM